LELSAEERQALTTRPKEAKKVLQAIKEKGLERLATRIPEKHEPEAR
jgi:hypothetical protein